MNADELKEVLRKHKLRLDNDPAGERAILSEADLRGADLRGADLSWSNLSDANLSGANLRDADLRDADLRWADLRWADLRGADLRWADLREAILRGANLHGADLRGAILSGADGNFVVGYFGRHDAVAAGGYINIGCERHAYDVWLEKGEQIGMEEGYTSAEIADYMDWIKLAIRALKRMEQKG